MQREFFRYLTLIDDFDKQIEVKCSIGAGDDPGRPTTAAIGNKENYELSLRFISLSAVITDTAGLPYHK